MKKLIRYTLIILLLALVVIQFIRPDRMVPDYDESQDFIASVNPPAEVAQLLKSACYDCHSWKTKYPWYDRIAPVSYWLSSHVNEGREELNFSLWGSYSPKRADHKLEESMELVEEGEMPLKSYTWTHAEARLNDAQRMQLIQFFQSLR